MFNWLLRLFGKKDTPITKSATVAPGSVPPRPTPTPTRKNVDRTKYYRKNGNFYSIDDGSLIEDLLMVAILTEMFDEPDYVPQNDGGVDELAADVAAVDAAVERESKILETPEYVEPEPTYTPEPTRSYASGASDYGSSSSYDSGGSDSSD